MKQEAVKVIIQLKQDFEATVGPGTHKFIITLDSKEYPAIGSGETEERKMELDLRNASSYVAKKQ